MKKFQSKMKNSTNCIRFDFKPIENRNFGFYINVDLKYIDPKKILTNQHYWKIM